MLQQFSRLVYDLYDAAARAGPPDFAGEALRLLRPWLRFDGAVLGMGQAEPPGGEDLRIVAAHVDRRDPAVLADYAAVSAGDPVTAAFCRGLVRPLACSCDTFYRQHKLEALRRFTARHDIRHLLLYGDPPAGAAPARWLVLYRGSGAPFAREAGARLRGIWPHLLRCDALSRQAVLSSLLPQPSQGYALLSCDSQIDIADAGFTRLCLLEWPQGLGRTLPAAAWTILRGGHAYLGVRVRIALIAEHGHLLCTIAERSSLDRLTPAERVVALQYGAGRSHKEIADALTVSANTVRTHVAHVFDKLDIHTKSELIRQLAAEAAPMRASRSGAPPAEAPPPVLH